MHNISSRNLNSRCGKWLGKRFVREIGRRQNKGQFVPAACRFRGRGVRGHQLRGCLGIGSGIPSSHYSPLPWFQSASLGPQPLNLSAPDEPSSAHVIPTQTSKSPQQFFLKVSAQSGRSCNLSGGISHSRVERMGGCEK